MKLLKNNMIILIRSKILLLFMVLTTVFSVTEVLRIYGRPISVTEPLGYSLTLAIYLFILMTYISYEYLRKFYNNGISEVLLTLDSKRKNIITAYLLMSLYAFLLSVIIAVLVIMEYHFYKINDPSNEYVMHIIFCVFVNIYLVMQLGITIGGALSAVKNRISAYTVMTFYIIAASPFACSMAYSVDMSDITGEGKIGQTAFKIVSLFYILPRSDLKWMPRAEFGEPILPYRLFAIFFWLFAFLSVAWIIRKKKIWKTAVLAIISVTMLFGYLYPSSNMEQKLDPYQNGVPDMMYVSSDEYVWKDESANYKIEEYDLDLSMRLNLSATATMKVSKILSEYKMTLYRKYKVSHVNDQDGNPLKYKQEQDYITIFNDDNREIKQITIQYKGSSSECYANSQGCYLPGYYLYYPRAGHIQVYDKVYRTILPNFVDKNTLFHVRVETGGKYISNLEKKDGEYYGTCDGFTLIRGFYKKKELEHGNVIVYPYLDNFVVHDGIMSEEDCWKENFEFSIKELEKDNITDSIIFMDADVLDGAMHKAYGDKQVFVNAGGAFYYSGP